MATKLLDLNKTSDPIGMMREAIHQQWEGYKPTDYEPTGVQEEIIATVGSGNYSIVVCLHNNKSGKTGTAANILQSIMWPDIKSPWFNYPLFNNWPYEARQGRIIGTVKNTSDDGPIRKEILRWWSPSRYSSEKNKKGYNSIYWTDTDWNFDVMTYEQDTDEFEGPFLSWTWCDEPPPERLVGAITSRFIGGGLWLITATPLNCGPLLSTLNDLKERGKTVAYLTANIWESSVTQGKPNSQGRKKGLWTDEMISDYVAGIPPDEYDARVKGEASLKSGVIYPDFDRRYHVIGQEHCYYDRFDINSAYGRASQCYTVIDPHRKGYPAIQWWMLTPNNDLICYNEFPTRNWLNTWYDEIRDTLTCPYSAEQLSKIIRTQDGTGYGLRMLRRAMDPRFGAATKGEYGRSTESLMAEYSKHGVDFELPACEKIDVQRDVIRDMLRCNKDQPINQYNKPRIFWMPHCENSIRCIERHYWDEEASRKGKERETDRYKDFVDTVRYLLALIGDVKWEAPPATKKRQLLDDPVEMPGVVHDVSLA
jgi:hypothetical protein